MVRPATAQRTAMLIDMDRLKMEPALTTPPELEDVFAELSARANLSPARVGHNARGF